VRGRLELVPSLKGLTRFLPLYPGLTPWAKSNFAPAGLDLRNRSAVPIKNGVRTDVLTLTFPYVVSAT
jgi:hypothetical protein